MDVANGIKRKSVRASPPPGYYSSPLVSSQTSQNSTPAQLPIQSPPIEPVPEIYSGEEDSDDGSERYM